MAVSATGLAYALIVLQGILLLISVLQLVQAAYAFRRLNAGQPTAPRKSLIFLSTAIVALVISYVFDIAVTAQTLVQGSETPPPSGAHLALVVVTTFLGQGLAPSMVYASAENIIESRVELSGLQDQDAASIRRRKLSKVVQTALIYILPVLIAAYLGVFCKAVLDTPILAKRYYAWLNIANGLYRAAVVNHALIFRGLASHAISFHLLSKSQSIRDLIMRNSILYHLTPSMFVRTIALFVFAPLSSSFATASTPASATALLFAYTFFVGLSMIAGVQSLLSGARLPATEWAPVKSPGEQEVHNGDVPGDHAAQLTHGRKRSRADSIALSPTRSTFGNVIREEENPTSS
ncbi:hypothetical protein CPB86DRAFT_805015 [Serendipita vermifera]|nr:hypothetical protein CPB86DRAFT_805015 [Serendipita vermifera]